VAIPYIVKTPALKWQFPATSVQNFNHELQFFTTSLKQARQNNGFPVPAMTVTDITSSNLTESFFQVILTVARHNFNSRALFVDAPMPKVITTNQILILIHSY
jgi:hypothetical protein